MLFVTRVAVAPALANEAVKPGPGKPPVQLAAVDQFKFGDPPPDQTPFPARGAVTNVQVFVVWTAALSVIITVIVLVELAGRPAGLKKLLVPTTKLLVTRGVAATPFVSN
jgi:hypothetical protein